MASPPAGNLVYDRLMTPSMDEIASDYGLLAEAIAYPDDFGFVKVSPAGRKPNGRMVSR